MTNKKGETMPVSVAEVEKWKSSGAELRARLLAERDELRAILAEVEAQILALPADAKDPA